MDQEVGGEEGKGYSQIISTLNAAWILKDIEQVRQNMRAFLATVDDPHTALLDLLESCRISRGKGSSLASILVNETYKWLQEHPDIELSGLRLRKLQARVFGLVTEGQLLDYLLAIYQLHRADRSFLLGYVTHLHDSGKYREAAILATKLKLQQDLDLEKMCTPLFLMERTNLMEAYVAGDPELQAKLLQMLDRWSESESNTRKLSREYKGLPPVKPHKANPKAISKLALRLLDLYQLDPSLCSNIINQRHLGTLKYLMYKRFVERSMTQETWSDHVQATVGENRWLQEQCIGLLSRHCDRQTVGHWALKFRLPKENLPQDVADILQYLCIQDNLSESERSADDVQARKALFYQLPIPRSRVHFLQSRTELSHCRDFVLEDGQVVGLDMEWKPTFGGLGKPNVSLIQIAVKEEVFILDLLHGDLLQNCEQDHIPEIVQFIKDLFSCPKVTKLGYGMRGDFQGLDATHCAFQGLELCNVIDLSEVHKQIQRCSSRHRIPGGPVEVLEGRPGEEGVRQTEKGLSLLVKEVLGKPLDKTEQLSNWDKRPLREDQVVYAAADAYCLLEVFEALLASPEKFGLKPNFHTRPKIKPPPQPKTKSPPKKETSLSVQKLKISPNAACPPNDTPVSPREFSVICDNMLQGLGRYLRCLGVDVLMLDNEEDHRKAAEIARRDGRVILTCGLPYQTLRSQIREGRCFHVNSTEKAREQAVQVLKHFNVRVTLADVFSRCQVCNCPKYLHISPQQMRQLMKLREPQEDSSEAQNGLEPRTAGMSESSDDKQDFLWMMDLGLAPGSLALPSGAQMQLDSVPEGLLEKVSLFYCCSQCGKVFWEGSHFGRVVAQFKDVLQDHGENFYQSVPQGL
ncbi:exonuclease mut-7 homolog [Hyperolius riggenbachi]|uniref:exonuclease mut-7 homolog n=1 Tax=Hyperolius riggenbachi TaxID=752182 RepID=UPI0035A3A822